MYVYLRQIERIMKYSGNITNDHITIISSDGESGTVNADHNSYNVALEAVREGRFDDFMIIANPVAIIHRYADGRITIDDGVVTFDGVELHNHLADRMVGLIQDGHGVEPLAHFLVNLYENTSKRAIDELYGFLEASNLEITADGYFVAYKKVSGDYLDCYTRTIDNTPGGAPIEMDRRDVDDDKDRTCSDGLHFCGRAYLDSYHGDRTVVLQINPKDVVSIPSDYNNHKGRCCKYIVIGELENGRDENGRTEQKLEGSLFTGEGIDTTDKTDDMTGVAPDNIVFYQSRAAARDAARQDQNVLRVKDFGADKDKGFRWATIEK